MKKLLLLLIPSIILLSCSTDSEEVNRETENSLPQINAQSFTIDEHSGVNTVVGTISATDANNDELTFTIDNESGLEIDKESGEITIGNNLLLDYEGEKSLPFTVSVFDGTSIVEQDFVLTINDIREYDLLSHEQKETITYFKYLAFWKGPSNNPIDKNTKWVEPMKLFLDGTISNAFKSNVESVISEINDLVTDGSFSISLVDNLKDSNTHLFFGETAEVEGVWPDMFDIIDGKTYNGYAMSSGTTINITSARIWISKSLAVLFKHELGHSIGLGHSNRCDSENSFMCSTIDPGHEILPIEQDVLRYLYHDNVSGGLSETEIENVLANIMLLED